MTVYYHPRALSWVTLSTPSSPAHPGTITGTPTYLVASPHNPDNCTCGRYTFVKKCSCIHASINIPCGRTRTPTSPAKFCGGKDVSLVPHHWVVDFVVSDECEDHPGFVLRPWPYKTTTTTTKTDNNGQTTRPAALSISEKMTPATGCGTKAAPASMGGDQTAPMARV